MIAGAVFKEKSYEEIQKRIKNFEKKIKEAEEKKRNTKVQDLKQQKDVWMKTLGRMNEISRHSDDCRLLYRCMDYFVGTPDSRSISWIEKYTDFFWREDVRKY